MLLKNLLKGSFHWQTILIKDGVDASCYQLVREIAKSRGEVILADYGGVSRALLEHHNSTDGPTLIHYNCLSTLSSLHSQSDEGNDGVKDIYGLYGELTREDGVSGDGERKRRMLLIDDSVCLTERLPTFLSNVMAVASLKYKSGESVCPVVMCINEFDDEDTVHTMVESMADVVISVSRHAPRSGGDPPIAPSRLNPTDASDRYLYITLTRIKRSGRASTERYRCHLEGGELKYEEMKALEKREADTAEVDEMDSLTSFKLTLSQREMEQRDRLVLPHIRMQEEVKRSGEAGGRIHYEADEADDLDEEDPDDDLHI